MKNEITLSLSRMTELVQSPGLALVLQERWKYSTWETCRARIGFIAQGAGK